MDVDQGSVGRWWRVREGFRWRVAAVLSWRTSEESKVVLLWKRAEMQQRTEVSRFIQDLRGRSEYTIGGRTVDGGGPTRKKPRAVGGQARRGKGARRQGMNAAEVDGMFNAKAMEAPRGLSGTTEQPIVRPQVSSASDLAAAAGKECRKRSAPATAAENVGRGCHPAQHGSEFSQGSDQEDSDSQPKKKRERERKRREVMNRRFSDLALLLPRSSNGKADKESVLAEAIENIRHQKNMIVDLNMRNQDFKAEIEMLRNEKGELRNDKNYLRSELAQARDEIRQLRSEGSMRMDRPTMMTFLQNVSVQPTIGARTEKKEPRVTSGAFSLPQQGQISSGGMRGASMSSEGMLDALQRKSLLSGTMSADLSQLTHGVDSSKTTSHNPCA